MQNKKKKEKPLKPTFADVEEFCLFLLRIKYDILYTIRFEKSICQIKKMQTTLKKAL